MKAFNTPVRLDTDKTDGDIIIFLREDSQAKLLFMYKSNETRNIEINLRCAKLLLQSTQNQKYLSFKVFEEKLGFL